MSREIEAPRIYEEFHVEESKSKVAETKSGKSWLVPVAIVLGALVAGVFLGIGFAVAYFAVPCRGMKYV